jgi:hypothetical protein
MLLALKGASTSLSLTPPTSLSLTLSSLSAKNFAVFAVKKNLNELNR